MPLRLIKGVIAEDPERAHALIELEDRIIQRAAAAQERGRVSRAEVRRRYEVPDNVLERLEDLKILAPNSPGYDADAGKIIEAISRFRAGGYDERIGFTVYDAVRYREALQPLVEEEVSVLLERLVGGRGGLRAPGGGGRGVCCSSDSRAGWTSTARRRPSPPAPSHCAS